MGPGLVIADLGGGSRKHLILFTQACNDNSVNTGHCCGWGFEVSFDIWDGGSKKKRSNRHCNVIVPYHAKNLQACVMQPPI